MRIAEHLATVLATLILLAYRVDTTLDRLDPRYRAGRAPLPLRQTCFEQPAGVRSVSHLRLLGPPV